LFLACKNNIPSLARFVLEQGANPFLKFKDEEKETTLIEYAIKNGASADFLNFFVKKLR